MVLGNMEVGINTQNLMAILLVIFLSMVNIFGVRDWRARSRTSSPRRKLRRCWAWPSLDSRWDGTRRPWPANFGGQLLA